MNTSTNVRLVGEALNLAILDCLRAGLSSREEIADKLQYSAQCIHTKLHALKREGRVYPTKNTFSARSSFVWHEGANPAKGHFDDEPAEIPITPLLTKASNAAPINRRDPLVAALFGERRKEPRCVCCGSSQSTGHVAGCLYLGAA